MNDQSEIQAEIRELHLGVSDLKDSTQKKHFLAQLSKEARRGLDTKLRDILQSSGLIDKALQLVLDCIMTVGELALRLYKEKKNTSDISGSYAILNNKLGKKLESRGALAHNGIDAEKPWVDKLTDRCPTINKLKMLEYSELLKLLQDVDTCDRSVVENLFAEGSLIRKQCINYGLGLETAEKCEKQGIRSAADMSENQFSKIAETLPGERRSCLRKLYSNESSEHVKEKERQEERRNEHMKRIEEAKKLVDETRNNARERFKENKKEFQERMKQITDKLELPQNWNIDTLDDPNQLLNSIENDLKIAEKNISLKPYDTNEEVVSAASGGVARYGINWYVGDVEATSKRPPFPILKNPEYVEWLSPSRGFDATFFKTTKQGASNFFYKSVESAGLSIAADASGSYLGFHASVASSYNQQSDETKTSYSTRKGTYASTTQYIVQPTKAFRIPRYEMQLDNEASNQALKICDSVTAQRFLEKYGSYVPAGVQTLGGTFFRIVDVETTEETTESTLLKASGKQFGLEVSAGYSAITWSVAGSTKTEKIDMSGTSTGSSSKNVEAQFKMKVKALGPPTTSQEMFCKLLQENNATWYVIDRGTRDALVPVWELLLDHGEKYRKPAELIKNAWDSKVYALLKRGQTSEQLLPLGGTGYGNQQSEMLIATNEMKKYILKQIEFYNQQPELLVETLANIFHKIQDIQLQYSRNNIEVNITAEALRIEEFRKVLLDVARGTQENSRIAQKMVRKMIDPVSLRGQIVLDPVLKKFLDEAKVETSNEAQHIKEIHTGDLHQELLELEKRLNFGELDNALACRQAAQMICSALKNEPNIELSAALKERAEIMGYQEDQLDFLTPLESNGLSILAREISAILNARFQRNAKVKFRFSSNSHDLGDGEIEAVGTVTNVMERLAYVRWDTLTNFKTGKPWKREKESRDWVLNWLGDSNNGPRKNKELQVQMPFWKLSSTKQDYGMDCGQVYYSGLKWHKEPKNCEGIRKQTVSMADFCIDKELHSTILSSHKDILYSLCHRMDSFKQIMSETGKGKHMWGKKKSNDSSKTIDNPFCLLLDLLSRCRLSAKGQLFRLLLNQRYSIPLVTPCPNGMLTYHVEALRFANIKLATGVLAAMTDTTLPRIAFVSFRSEAQTENAHLINEVLKCNIPSSSYKEACGTVAELGVGFLQNERNYDPWLTMYVRGDFKPLWKFIIQFADFIVVELNPEDNPAVEISGQSSVRKNQRIVRWRNRNDLPEPDYTDEGDVMAISGSFHDVSREMAGTIIYLCETFQATGRKPLSEINTPRLKMDDKIIGLKEIGRQMDGVSIGEARQKLEMQKHFAEKCEIELKLKRVRGSEIERRDMDVQRNELINICREISSQQMNLPLLRQFLGLLSETDPELRVTGMQQFEKCINGLCESLLQKEKRTKDKAWELYTENSNDPDMINRYYIAKKEYASKSIGIEHLWRELSHIYIARRGAHADLPIFAAQHLLDGFALEIMDGDAGGVNIDWVKDVISALNNKLETELGRKPKLFVISIMGAQSTGKSTLLNTMFGCRLRTSAGQCTRGVNLQLAKAEGRSGYDYVLIMDTEGIRNPEYFNTEGAIWRDNRMATFAVLPAHVCIITTVNEDDSAIKEVLPIVMLAFKGSNIAEEKAGRMSSLLFFVYSRVDTSKEALAGFEQNRRQLIVELQTAANKVAGSKVASYESQSSDDATVKEVKSLQRFFAHFQTSEEESKSDVKYLGLLNKGENPPDDTPNFAYGDKVRDIRRYIQRRMDEYRFEGQSLEEWIHYLELVLNCINTADFELNFKTALQYQSHSRMQEKLNDAREQVSKDFSEKFSDIEIELRNIDKKKKPNIKDLISKFHESVKVKLMEQKNVVIELFEQPEYKQFKIDEMRQWECFVIQKQKTWDHLLTDTFETKFTFHVKEEEIEMSILKELKAEWERNPTHLENKEDQKKIFNRIFQKHVEQAQREFPSLNVEQKIRDDYKGLVIEINIAIDRWYTRFIERGKEGAKESWRNLLQFVGIRDKPNVEKVALQLQSQVTSMLRSVNRYDDELVRAAIAFTYESFPQNYISSKEQKKHLHQIVFVLLVKRFKLIQGRWDEKNNIAAKLEHSRERLLEKFINICNRVVGVHAIASDITNALKQAVRDGFNHYLASRTFNNVKHKKWLRSPDTMQAHIDLDLISLIKEGRANDLLLSIEKSPGHYNKVLTKLIVEFSEEEETWKEMVDTIKYAVSNAASCAQQFESDFGKDFQRRLKTDLPFEVMDKFPPGVWDDVLNDKTLKKQDWQDIGTEIEKSVSLWGTKRTELTSCISDKELSKLVVEVVERERGVTSVSQRCSAACPHCKMLCIEPAGHEGDISEQARLHNTHHQPRGNSGVGWSGSRELVEKSCTQHVEDNDRFHVNEEWVPYSNFCKVYPSWSLPHLKKSLKLREYIFSNYQDELVKRYRNTQHCPKQKILSYNHDLDEIERERELAARDETKH